MVNGLGYSFGHRLGYKLGHGLGLGYRLRFICRARMCCNALVLKPQVRQIIGIELRGSVRVRVTVQG